MIQKNSVWNLLLPLKSLQFHQNFNRKPEKWMVPIIADKAKAYADNIKREESGEANMVSTARFTIPVKTFACKENGQLEMSYAENQDS